MRRSSRSETRQNGTGGPEQGNVIVEFVGVMAILVVPAVIALLAVSALLMGQSALSAAARDGARAFVRSDSGIDAYDRAQAVAQQALDSRGVDAVAHISVVCSDDPCLSPGATVTLTVQADIDLPYVAPVRLTQESTMQVDEFRPVRE
ncbi:MAG: TadE/TadG family type IV pilus assembly protein [Ancrocorticia sp.]|uniref:TadE/TadG family type IV pilus assembly protein n=1 Tax=Ancrocorticia sp. TaxID=2593684 RepID=UPI003F8FDF92